MQCHCKKGSPAGLSYAFNATSKIHGMHSIPPRGAFGVRSTLLTWTVIAAVTAAATLAPVSSRAARAETPDPLVAMFVCGMPHTSKKTASRPNPLAVFHAGCGDAHQPAKDRCRRTSRILAQAFPRLSRHAPRWSSSIYRFLDGIRLAERRPDLHAPLRSEPGSTAKDSPRTGHGLRLHQRTARSP